MFVKLTIPTFPCDRFFQQFKHYNWCSSSPRRFHRRNNLCRTSFDSNVKYESNDITASSSRQYHAGILIFGSTRTMIRKRSPCLPHKRDVHQPLSANSIARGGVGGGLIVIRYSNTCLKSFRTPILNREGMLRGTDNFYFILITFSFKLELV